MKTLNTLKIHSVETLAALDGEGLRTAFFLQGCPAKCFYCHNADTQTTSGGEKKSATDILKIASRGKPYFGEKGGVTFSGGEPLLQAAALVPAVKLLKENGINVTLDTSGAVHNDDVKVLLSMVDAVLLDIKMPTEKMYKAHTGINLKAALAVLECCMKAGVKTTIRYVAVPGVNDKASDIEEVINLIEVVRQKCENERDSQNVDSHIQENKRQKAGSTPKERKNQKADKIPTKNPQFKLTGFEVLAFHKLGEDKFQKLGRECLTADIPPLGETARAELQAVADCLLKAKSLTL